MKMIRKFESESNIFLFSLFLDFNFLFRPSFLSFSSVFRLPFGFVSLTFIPTLILPYSLFFFISSSPSSSLSFSVPPSPSLLLPSSFPLSLSLSLSSISPTSLSLSSLSHASLSHSSLSPASLSHSSLSPLFPSPSPLSLPLSFSFFSRKTFKGKASNAFVDHAFLRLISRLLISRRRL